jgi:hypothetical protein
LPHVPLHKSTIARRAYLSLTGRSPVSEGSLAAARYPRDHWPQPGIRGITGRDEP